MPRYFTFVPVINRKTKWFCVGAGEQLDAAVFARITSRVFSCSSRRGHATSCFSGGRITVSSFEVRFPFFTTKVRSSYALSFQISFPFFSVILEAFLSARQSLYLCLRVETLPFALKNKEPERHVYFFLKRITRTSRDVLSFYFLLSFYLFPLLC